MLLLASLGHAAVFAGLAYVPPGIGAFAFDDANAWSDTLAGEWDGWLRPPLTARAGWMGARTAVTANVAVVEIVDYSYAENTHRSSLGGVRLGIDARHYLFPRAARSVNFFPCYGLFGIVPNAAESDSEWTVEESDAAAEESRDRRARIGGVGAQAGLGMDYAFADAKGEPAILLGGQWVVRGFGGLDVATEQTDFSLFLLSEVAITLEFVR
jgi:hypothetical protein